MTLTPWILLLFLFFFLLTSTPCALTMSDNEKKALELVAEAEKKLGSSKSFLGGLFG